ncbi:MAG: hypothetical protein U0234_26275 [Sandaracinus sp.]
MSYAESLKSGCSARARGASDADIAQLFSLAGSENREYREYALVAGDGWPDVSFAPYLDTVSKLRLWYASTKVEDRQLELFKDCFLVAAEGDAADQYLLVNGGGVVSRWYDSERRTPVSSSVASLMATQVHAQLRLGRMRRLARFTVRVTLEEIVRRAGELGCVMRGFSVHEHRYFSGPRVEVFVSPCDGVFECVVFSEFGFERARLVSVLRDGRAGE